LGRCIDAAGCRGDSRLPGGPGLAIAVGRSHPCHRHSDQGRQMIRSCVRYGLRDRLRAVVLLAGLGLVACGAQVVSPGVSPELKHSWEVAFNKGDADTVAKLYSPDAQLVMTGSAPILGRAAIRAAVETMIQSGSKVRIGMDQNVGSGDLAYV